MLQDHDAYFDIQLESDRDEIADFCRALSSPFRVQIYSQLCEKPHTLKELAKRNNVSISAIKFHTDIMEQCKIIRTRVVDSERGYSTLCSIVVAHAEMSFQKLSRAKAKESFTQAIGVGCYTKAFSEAHDGFVCVEDKISISDDIYNTKRFSADLFWVSNGYAEYDFSSTFVKNHIVSEIGFTFEICSEVSYYRNDAKSDITFFVNDTEVITYRSPGDFGGRSGKLNPEWYDEKLTQYGQLVSVVVNENGTYVNGILSNSKIKISDIPLDEDKLKFRIENKKDAVYRNGFNLFGKNFGDYDKDIVFTATCSAK